MTVLSPPAASRIGRPRGGFKGVANGHRHAGAWTDGDESAPTTRPACRPIGCRRDALCHRSARNLVLRGPMRGEPLAQSPPLPSLPLPVLVTDIALSLARLSPPKITRFNYITPPCLSNTLKFTVCENAKFALSNRRLASLFIGPFLQITRDQIRSKCHQIRSD